MDLFERDSATAPASLRASLVRRLCQRLGRWCGFLLDAHQARIPF